MSTSSPRPPVAASSSTVGQEKPKKKSMRALREEQNAEVREKNKGLAESRLDYLQEQVELFSNPALRAEREQQAKRGRGKKAKQDDDEENEEAVDYIANQPECIGGEMRPYQMEGLRWMVSLYDRGSSMILADEMGLGKTLQSISLLGYLKFDRQVNGPHLVVVPLAVLTNWEREFARWCPKLRVVSIHGVDAEDRHRQVKKGLVPNKFDVVLTTFEVLRIEKARLTRFHYQIMVVDEAHRLKNDESLSSQVCRDVKANYRLALTGTPLQNNLRELWALLNFLLPDIFRDRSMFTEDAFQLQDLKEDRVASRLHSILTPFMLRRLKVDAEKAMPPKREIKLYCGMSELQSYWYKSVLSQDLQALNQLGASVSKLNNLLTHLRKVCNHPYLFDGAEPGPPFVEGAHLWENCGKMVLLDKLLAKLKANGDRVLIFSQMTRMLDLLEDYMLLKQYKYCRLDGATKGVDRTLQMDDFNRPQSDKFCFLLSTRAGGLGINLQTANVVVLYDSDWNPQVDLQAQDRAHRIGQTKEVTVFRLITEGTLEEKIVERAEQKLFLDAVIVQQGNLKSANQALTKDDVSSMIRFGAETIFRSGGVRITDEDIDTILARGEAKTEATRKKIQDNVQFNLGNFEIVEKSASFTKSGLAPLLELARTQQQEELGKRERKPANFFAAMGKQKPAPRPKPPAPVVVVVPKTTPQAKTKPQAKTSQKHTKKQDNGAGKQQQTKSPSKSYMFPMPTPKKQQLMSQFFEARPSKSPIVDLSKDE